MPSSWSWNSWASTPSMRPGGIFSAVVLEQRPGYLVLQVSGKKAAQSFKHEGGGHRWQRIPPTERKGRVHTSTITVAVLPVPVESEIRLDDKDLVWTTCRGSGAGGQHKNVTDSAVRVQHKPSGLVVCCEGERSQHQNRQAALGVLRARLKEREGHRKAGARNASRRAQLGSGMRGDKRRSVRLQADQVKDHVLGRKMKARAYLRGGLEVLYEGVK